MKKTKHEVFPHFPIEVVKQRYLGCQCPRERTHWHIIWLLGDTTHPRTPREVAEIVGCTPDWVRKLLKRYNAEGEAALPDCCMKRIQLIIHLRKPFIWTEGIGKMNRYETYTVDPTSQKTRMQFPSRRCKAFLVG